MTAGPGRKIPVARDQLPGAAAGGLVYAGGQTAAIVCRQTRRVGGAVAALRMPGVNVVLSRGDDVRREGGGRRGSAGHGACVMIVGGILVRRGRGNRPSAAETG